MARNIDDIIKDLPPRRQAKIAALSKMKIEETLAYAKTLADIRKATGKTQAEVARQLGIQQHAVSQLESRTDTLVSTLRKTLQSLGLKLELSVIGKDGIRIELPYFLDAPMPRKATANRSARKIESTGKINRRKSTQKTASASARK